MNRSLIVLVDDDPAMLETVASALREAYDVRAYASAVTALDDLERVVPDAIVSDIVMPGVGGFEFRRQYASRFAARRTPFLFLSSLGDDETMVAGLESGADDYLVKPVAAAILRARVRATLRRATPSVQSDFRGDLADVPFMRLLQFCETKRFTGALLIESDDVRVSLKVLGGELDPVGASAWIDKLWDLTRGTFVLRSASVDFGELNPSAGGRPHSAPSSRLSAVAVRGRSLQITTEVVAGDTPTVVSLVLAGKEPVAKFRKRVPPEADAAAIQSLIDAQHQEAEAATHDRVSALRHQSQHGSAPVGVTVVDVPEPPPGGLATARVDAPLGEAEVSALFDEGFERSRRGEWAEALVCWERALRSDPDNRTLAINVDVAKKKLGRT